MLFMKQNAEKTLSSKNLLAKGSGFFLNAKMINYTSQVPKNLFWHVWWLGVYIYIKLLKTVSFLFNTKSFLKSQFEYPEESSWPKPIEPDSTNYMTEPLNR